LGDNGASFVQSHAIDTTPASIQDVIQRPWWQRTWVLQEILLAKKVVISCGRHMFEWPTRTEQIRDFEANLDKGKGLYFPMLRRIDFQIIRDFLLLQSQLKSTERSRLHDLVHEMHNRKCTDPRDKVFALLGLAADTDVKQNAANYSLSVKRVYQRLARTCLGANSVGFTDGSAEKWMELSDMLPISIVY
jgi:hypothetical protein